MGHLPLSVELYSGYALTVLLLANPGIFYFVTSPMGLVLAFIVVVGVEGIVLAIHKWSNPWRDSLLMNVVSFLAGMPVLFVLFHEGVVGLPPSLKMWLGAFLGSVLTEGLFLSWVRKARSGKGLEMLITANVSSYIALVLVYCALAQLPALQ